MEETTIIREDEIPTTKLGVFEVIYVGDQRCPLTEARVCIAKLVSEKSRRYLLVDIRRKPDQITYDKVRNQLDSQLRAQQSDNV